MSLFYRLMVYVRPRVFSKYDVHSDHIEIWNGKKCKNIEFSQIARIRFSWTSPRFLGGFTVILKTGQRFLFSSILEDSQIVLTQIKNHSPALVSEEEYSRYLKLTQWTPHAWDRIKERFGQVPLVLVKLFALPLIVAFAYCYQQSGSLWGNEVVLFWWVLLGCFVLNLIVALALNVIEERVASSTFFKNKARNKELEKKVFLLTTAVHFLLAALSVIFTMF
ncbi:MAG: hypothetical protein R2827_06580 [Bdellovibrionales bacterium]